MAASPIPESMPGTPTPRTITPPGNDSHPEFRDLKLEQWKIGERILKANERHSEVYSVLISETGQLAEDLEAHVFSFRDVEPKLRKYRQRCIKRMRERTKLKVEVDKISIVIITTSQTESTDIYEYGAEPRSAINETRQETAAGTSSVGKVKQKTSYQRESQRIRQNERRQAKRRAERLDCDGMTAQGDRGMKETSHQASLRDRKNKLRMFVVFLCELLDSWGLWKATTYEYFNPAKVLEEYLMKTAASLKTLKETESYLKARRREIILLRRHQVKVSRAVLHHMDQLVDERPQEELEDQLNLVILEGLANVIIDNLLVPCKFVVRLFEHKTSIGHLHLTSDELQRQRESLKRRFPWYQNLMDPGYPPTFDDVLRLINWVRMYDEDARISLSD